MSSFANGQIAEQKAAELLTDKGYQVVDRNWRTNRCEIDIVAIRQSCVYFFEVKYRSQNSHGTAAEQISIKKLAQMRYAARTWLHYHRWNGSAGLGFVLIDGHDVTIGLLNA